MPYLPGAHHGEGWHSLLKAESWVLLELREGLLVVGSGRSEEGNQEKGAEEARLTWRQTGATSEGSSHTTCHREYHSTYKDRKTATVNFISKCPATVCKGLKQRRQVIPLCPFIAARGLSYMWFSFISAPDV